MEIPIDRTLRDDDFFLVVLSGSGDGGRLRNLKSSLVKVLYNEEHPEPKIVEGVENEIEPHELIQGRFFTDITRLPSKAFDIAWLGFMQSGVIEPIGFGGDYVIYPQIVGEARKIKTRCGISDENYSYLTGLGKRVRELR